MLHKVPFWVVRKIRKLVEANTLCKKDQPVAHNSLEVVPNKWVLSNSRVKLSMLLIAVSITVMACRVPIQRRSRLISKWHLALEIVRGLLSLLGTAKIAHRSKKPHLATTSDRAKAPNKSKVQSQVVIRLELEATLIRKPPNKYTDLWHLQASNSARWIITIQISRLQVTKVQIWFNPDQINPKIPPTRS